MSEIELRNSRVSKIATGGAIAVILALALTAGWEVQPAESRRYRGGGYRRPGYGRYIRQCKRSCGSVKRTHAFCAKQDRQEGFATCLSAFQASLPPCVGNKTCTKAAAKTYRSCKRGVLGRLKKQLSAENKSGGRCSRCCQRNKGQVNCRGAFGYSRFYGSSTGNCVEDGDSGSGSGGGGGGGAGGGKKSTRGAFLDVPKH